MATDKQGDHESIEIHIRSTRGPSMLNLLDAWRNAEGAPEGLSNYILHTSDVFVEAVKQRAPWTLHDQKRGKLVHSNAPKIASVIDRMVASGGLLLTSSSKSADALNEIKNQQNPATTRAKQPGGPSR